MYVAQFDITNILAIGGNGVDLFFVISGFCMFYFYASKTDFSYCDFFRFLVKRWVRLSPAFYVATIIFIVVGKSDHQNNDSIYKFIHNVFYLNFIFSQYNIASHFWTLTVEWQFYFIIPFLLIYKNTLGFAKTFSIIFGIILLLGVMYVLIWKTQSDQFTSTILFHAVQFGCGILAAKQLMNSNVHLKYRFIWLITFLVILYSGRILISKPIFALSIYYYNLLRLLGFTLMGIGFAGILYLSITSVKWLNIILGNRLFKSMGRISYSFYLFHALVIPIVATYVMMFIPLTKSLAGPILTAFISAIILYPISQLSYNLLEKPYLSIGNLTTK